MLKTVILACALFSAGALAPQKGTRRFVLTTAPAAAVVAAGTPVQAVSDDAYAKYLEAKAERERKKSLTRNSYEKKTEGKPTSSYDLSAAESLTKKAAVRAP